MNAPNALGKRLAGKRALITGAARGIGAAIARAFAAEGARVLITDIDLAAAEALAAQVPGGIACRLDVTNAEDWRTALAHAQDAMGGLSVLVNNAGAAVGGSIATLSLEEWRRAFAVNADGAFLGCQLALPLLAENPPAAIINIASSAALHARAEMAAYGASKAALWSLTRSVALYCANQGLAIRANAILPAFVETPMLENFGREPEAVRARLARQLPLGRIASAEDIAAGAVYLASEESAFMTGADLRLDGGLSAL